MNDPARLAMIEAEQNLTVEYFQLQTAGADPKKIKSAERRLKKMTQMINRM